MTTEIEGVLIVGGNGYVGKALLKHFSSCGVATTSWSSAGNGPGLDAESGLFRSGSDIPPGIDTVIYLAQSPFYRNVPEQYGHLLRVNSVAPAELAVKACEAGVKRFLYASTGSVYAPAFDPLSESSLLNSSNYYAMSKISGENNLMPFHGEMTVTAMRIFGIFGPGQEDKLLQNLAKRVRDGESLSLDQGATASAAGGLRISLLYIDDACRIIEQLASGQGESGPINVAGPEAMSIRELGEALAQRFGTAAVFEQADRQRAGDLVADVSALAKRTNVSYTPLEAAVAASFPR